MNKRLLAGIAAAGIIGGGTYGFAATLNLTSDNLGADSSVVASCDPTNGIDVSYTTAYNSTAGRYDVTHVTLNDVAAACNGQALKVTLSGAANASLTQFTGTATTGNQTVDVTDVDAEQVTGVHVVISGDTTP